MTAETEVVFDKVDFPFFWGVLKAWLKGGKLTIVTKRADINFKTLHYQNPNT